MKTKFTVGELAKIYHMPKQNLIFYDRIDLFKPKYVDPHNKYRYYTAEQLEVLNSILILKETGIPLKDIRSFLEVRTSERAIDLMKEQKKHVDQQLHHLKQISKRLQTKIQTLEDLNQVEKKVSFKHLPKEYLAIEAVKAPYTLLEIDIASKQLFKKATDIALPYSYQLGVMIPLDKLYAKHYIEAQYAFVPLDKKVAQSYVIEKPEGLYATAYHTGNYYDIGLTYEHLFQAITLAGYTPKDYAYEYCVLDSLTSQTPEDYVTALHILVC